MNNAPPSLAYRFPTHIRWCVIHESGIDPVHQDNNLCDWYLHLALMWERGLDSQEPDKCITRTLRVVLANTTTKEIDEEHNLGSVPS